MNLRALKSLIAIAEHGSFQEAAHRLGLTQSAISMQIKTLEDTLDLVLLDRRERPPKLTDIGETILSEARIMLAAETRIQTIARKEAHISGTLFLGVIPTASVELLPEILTSLKNEHPYLGIKVESGLSGDLIERLRQGSLDAAMVTEPEILDPVLNHHLLLDEPLVLIDGRQNNSPLHLGMLGKRSFIRFNRRAGVGQSIERLLSHLGYQVRSHNGTRFD